MKIHIQKDWTPIQNWKMCVEPSSNHWPLKFGLQVVNVPSYIVRLDSQKHIDFSLKSPLGGGRPGRVKRKNAKKGKGGGDASDDE